MKSEKNSCLLKFHSSMILPCGSKRAAEQDVDDDDDISDNSDLDIDLDD